MAQVDIPKGDIGDFCRRSRIRRLFLFGSVLHGNASAKSDDDMLVEFEPGVRVGLRFFDI